MYLGRVNELNYNLRGPFRGGKTFNACLNGRIDDSLLNLAFGVKVHSEEAQDSMSSFKQLNEFLLFVCGLCPLDIG